MRRHIMLTCLITIPSMPKPEQVYYKFAIWSLDINFKVTVQHGWNLEELEEEMAKLWWYREFVQVGLA
jgi:hypothetical protein